MQSHPEEGGVRRTTRQNLGRQLPPKRIKDRELDDGNYLRANPLLIPLDEIPREWIINGNKGAVWHYSAVQREDPDIPGVLRRWRVMLGSEQLLTVLGRKDFLKLLGSLRKGALKQQQENPEENIKYPTQRDLEKGIDGLGHTTIAVDFHKDGKAKRGAAAISGEFRYDPELEFGTANDKSGRFMSKGARPNERDRDPELVAKWGEEVAQAFSNHLRKPVVFDQIKTLSNPTAGHASRLQPTAGQPASSAARPALRTQARSANQETHRQGLQ